METRILYSKPLVRHLKAQIKEHVTTLDTPPELAIIRVGDDPASKVYVGAKQKAAAKVGMQSRQIHLPANVTQETLQQTITDLNNDEAVTGILLQLPLPAHLNKVAALNAIATPKDVDGLCLPHVARQELGLENTLLPATPLGVLRLLEWLEFNLHGADVCMVGRSDLVGRPLASLMALRDATVTMCHKATRDLKKHTQQADLVIVAAGVPGLVTGPHLKPGATVIDVGINETFDAEGTRKLVGDVDFDSCLEIASTLTPVPGCVGPMTVTSLLTNVVDAAYMQQGKPRPVWDCHPPEKNAAA